MLIKYTVEKINKSELEEQTSVLLKTHCLGQCCEDFLVNLLFKKQTNGVYIDIGAHDGIRFSNSYAFSILGWKGICVEAHPDYYNICCLNRSNNNTKTYNIACSNKDSDEITFYANYRGSLSTLNTNLNEVYKRDYRGYYIDKNYTGKVNNFINGPITIKSKTMNTLIEEHIDFLNNGNIDFITIDVDGSEEFVLNGFDILKYKPRVIVFEVSVVRKVVENYMKDKNYFKLYDNNLNAIYCRDKIDEILFHNELDKIKDKTIISYDTGHPLGN
jgi:FkbM family methyltransferase